MIAFPNSMQISNYLECWNSGMLECWDLELDEVFLLRALIGFRLIQTQFSIIPLFQHSNAINSHDLRI